MYHQRQHVTTEVLRLCDCAGWSTGKLTEAQTGLIRVYYGLIWFTDGFIGIILGELQLSLAIYGFNMGLLWFLIWLYRDDNGIILGEL